MSSEIPRFHTDIPLIRRVLVVNTYRWDGSSYILEAQTPLSLFEYSTNPQAPVQSAVILPPISPPPRSPSPPPGPLPTLEEVVQRLDETVRRNAAPSVPMDEGPPATTPPPRPVPPPAAPRPSRGVREALRRSVVRRGARRIGGGGVRFSLPPRPSHPPTWVSPPRRMPAIRPPGPAAPIVIPDSPDSPDPSPSASPYSPASPLRPGSPPAAALGRSPSRSLPPPQLPPSGLRRPVAMRDAATQLRTVLREQTPPIYEHTRRPEDPRRHFTIVPSWGSESLRRRRAGESVVSALRKTDTCRSSAEAVCSSGSDANAFQVCAGTSTRAPCAETSASSSGHC